MPGPHVSDIHSCMNCKRPAGDADRKYCPGCGQPVLAPRIDWKLLAHEFEHVVLDMDRGLFFTLRMLMLRPGRLIRDYLEGRRAGHVKPLWLLMVTAAVVVFLTQYLPSPGNAVGEFSAGMQTGLGSSQPDETSRAMVDAFQSIGEWVRRHFAAVTLLLLPLEALVFRIAFWRVKGLNYPEWLTIIAFLTAQVFVIWSCFILIGHWFPIAHHATLWVILAYMMFSLMQAFEGYARWKTLLRGLLGYGVYLLANLGLLVVATMILTARSIGLGP